jgi:hypothetical protein
MRSIAASGEGCATVGLHYQQGRNSWQSKSLGTISDNSASIMVLLPLLSALVRCCIKRNTNKTTPVGGPPGPRRLTDAAALRPSDDETARSPATRTRLRSVTP